MIFTPARNLSDAHDLRRAADVLERRLRDARKKSFLLDVLIASLRKVAAGMEAKAGQMP